MLLTKLLKGRRKAAALRGKCPVHIPEHPGWGLQGEARVLPSTDTPVAHGMKDSAGSLELREGPAVSLCQQRGWAAVTALPMEQGPAERGWSTPGWQIPTPETESWNGLGWKRP